MSDLRRRRLRGRRRGECRKHRHEQHLHRLPHHSSTSGRGTILHADNFDMAFFPGSDAAVRDAIYASAVEHGAAPLPGDIALTTGLDPAEVGAAVQRLADAHVIVLEPGT